MNSLYIYIIYILMYMLDKIYKRIFCYATFELFNTLMLNTRFHTINSLYLNKILKRLVDKKNSNYELNSIEIKKIIIHQHGI